MDRLFVFFAYVGVVVVALGAIILGAVVAHSLGAMADRNRDESTQKIGLPETVIVKREKE